MISQWLTVTIYIIQALLFFYFGFTIIILLIFSIAGVFPYHPKINSVSDYKKIAVLIPAYSEDEVIIEVAENALKHDYPNDKYDVIIIADSFHQGTIDRLKELDIIVFAKDFEISTKSRALNYALNNLDDNYDIACILDADNIMLKGFLKQINAAMHKGFAAVQGHRTAKNLNTNFAVLDAVSEEINNQIFRKGQRVLGLSSFLIGSAMAFDYHLFKSMMAETEVVGGFDKELEMRLLSQRQRTEYLPNAIVLDEKVQNARVFTKQRRRWLSAQFHFFGKKFYPALLSIGSGNFEYFFKALHYLQPPRILLLGITTLIVIISVFFNSKLWLTLWLLTFILLIMVFVFAIPRKFYTFRTLKAVMALPKGFLLMMLSLVKIRRANEKFIHTKHTYNAFQIKKRK